MASTLRTLPAEFPATPEDVAVPVEINLTRFTEVAVEQPLTQEVSVVVDGVSTVE